MGKGKGRLLLSPLTYLHTQLNTTAKTRSPLYPNTATMPSSAFGAGLYCPYCNH